VDFLVHGEKGHDRDTARHKIKGRGAVPNISSRVNPPRKYHFSPVHYRNRNAIGRMFARIRKLRRVVTRYDRLSQNSLATVCLVATICYCL